MIVNLQSMWTEAFHKEISQFPDNTKEAIFSLVNRFLDGEQLHQKDFKIFKIDENTKIMEFKVKDERGNWRAISTIINGRYLVFVYAFHKKSQKLKEKDKANIRNRIKRIKL